MRPPTAYALLLLACAACAGSRRSPELEWWGADQRQEGSTLEASWEGGLEAVRLESDEGALEARVTRVVHATRRSEQRIEVHLRTFNGLADEVHFALHDVRLDFGRVRIAAQVQGEFGDPQPDLLPGTSKDHRWTFPLPREADAALYSLTVEGFRTAGGRPLFEGRSLRIEVPVPGVRTDEPEPDPDQPGSQER